MKRSALIYRPSKSAMQSGTRNMNQWKLEIRSDSETFVDPTMGWIGGVDTTRQLNISFDTHKEAVSYCESKGIFWSDATPKERKLKPKSYANNFSTGKRRYSDLAMAKKIDL
ncbi:MAG: ETC complex I subunit [Rickettsiales bacterium]|nr:ETC complex I subunit [Rickettsiales bacterium]